MSPELARDLRILRDIAWNDELQVAEIARAVTEYIEESEERLERLDKVEGILDKLEKDGKTDVLKHFEALKV